MSLDKKGQTFVISGPSGVGKSTVLKALFEGRDDLYFSVSATTRSPRPGERHGVDYHFIEPETFRQWIMDGEFLEYAEYVGNFYGTPKKYVDEAMAAGKPTIIAGNEGYIGIFDEDKAELAYSTNFCCRGCEASSEEKIAQDVGNFFGMWEEDKKRLSAFSREYIKENYSVKRMADDAEKVYKSVLAERKG